MPYIQALGTLGHGVTVVVEARLTEERIRMGWSPGQCHGLTVIENPDENTVKTIVHDSDRQSIHLLAGARGKTLGNTATREILLQKKRIGIISESPDRRGPAVMLRWLKYTKERLGPGRNFDFLLTMGELGANWFRACGYPPSKILEFAYVVEPASVTTPCNPCAPQAQPCAAEQQALRILYAGQLIHRKGLDTFLRALALLNGEFHVNLIGSGPKESELKHLGETLGISHKLQWRGRLPAEEVRKHMFNADVFVLPSYHDGWGAVVNEALMAGTPVIASQECGASCLLRESYLGASYPAKDAKALTRLLQERIDAGPLSSAQREKIAKWSKCIHPHTMARYFVECMEYTYEDGPKPMAPWKLNA